MKKIVMISGILLVAAFAGTVDSTYVTLHSSQAFVIPCGFAGGCEQVLNSPYSRIFGIPVAWLGFGFYVTVAATSLFALFGFAKALRLSFAAAVPAFAFTVYLVWVQAFVLRAFCDYCLLSAFLVILIFGLHLWAKPLMKSM